MVEILEVTKLPVRTGLLRRLFKLVALLMALAIGVAGAGMVFRPTLDDALFQFAESPAEFKPGELRAQFLGTSTLLIGDGRSALLVDGFFSRPAWWKLLALPLEPDDSRIAQALAQAGVSRLDAILVAHSHHDHALDSARVAARTGAIVHGSDSTLQIARGDRLPAAQMRLLQPGKPMRIGEFTVTAVETPHSPGALFPGRITAALALPARLWRFKEAESYSFHFAHAKGHVLVVPSANFAPGALAGLKADVVFLGIGRLGKQSEAFTRAYWQETVMRTGARRVVPIHWDDFGLPLDQPLVALPFALDRVDVSLARLSQLAAASRIDMKLARSFSPIALP